MADLFNQNSLDNWFNEIKPTLTEREAIVLNEIKLRGKGSCRNIAERLDVFPHTISGRFTKLKEKNLIRSCGHELIGNRRHEIFELNKD